MIAWFWGWPVDDLTAAKKWGIMNQADTCHTYILPNLKSAGWEDERITEQMVLTPGRIVPVGDKLNGVNFRMQHAIGNYIPDFCSPKARLVIELDGSQHLEQKEYDEERTKYLESQGFRVIRLWNNQVMNDIEGVIKAVIDALESDDKRGSRH